MNETYSINALSNQLGTDRRTLTKLLRHVPPEAKDKHGSPRYSLPQVIEALRGTTHELAEGNPIRAICELVAHYSFDVLCDKFCKAWPELSEGLPKDKADEILLRLFTFQCGIFEMLLKSWLDHFMAERLLPFDSLAMNFGVHCVSKPPSEVRVHVPAEVRRILAGRGIQLGETALADFDK